MPLKYPVMKSTAFAAAFGSLFFAAALHAQASEINSEMAIENYQQADANGDGNLTVDEFTAFINLNADDGVGRAGMIRDRNMHGFAFRRIDANSDGLVSAEEMSAMAR
ncbi:MAG: hypothetical protein AAF940_02560 [Pseudomonadota bacterium]